LSHIIVSAKTFLVRKEMNKRSHATPYFIKIPKFPKMNPNSSKTKLADSERLSGSKGSQPITTPQQNRLRTCTPEG